MLLALLHEFHCLLYSIYSCLSKSLDPPQKKTCPELNKKIIASFLLCAASLSPMREIRSLTDLRQGETDAGARGVQQAPERWSSMVFSGSKGQSPVQQGFPDVSFEFFFFFSGVSWAFYVFK